MKYSQATYGRVFVIRLEDGDIVHEAIERFARENDVSAAALIVLGGADAGSRLVVGPEEGRSQPVVTLEHVLGNVHEVAGTGTIFPDTAGKPVLHMHIAAGRVDAAVAGCARKGVKVWHVMEVVLFELADSSATRVTDPATGFELLRP
jgi:predicted DNA-binding protein with PD1-like motif